MTVAFRDDNNIFYSDLDGGSITNISDDIVLLRMPSKQELDHLYREFETELYDNILKLLSTPYGELVKVHGSLSTSEKYSEHRKSTLFAFITTGTDVPKFINIEKSALALAMVELGYAAPETPHHKKRKRLTRGMGNIAHIIERMSIEEQLTILRYLIDSFDIDRFFTFDQSSRALIEGTRDFIDRCKTSKQALEHIAKWTRSHVLEPVDRKNREFTGKGGGYDYAPIWFAQFLARKGVWLLPVKWIGEVRRFYPTRLRPLLAWMSVPPECLDIADAIAGLERVQKQHSSMKIALSVLAVTALSSDIWSTRRFCSAPLECLKKAMDQYGHTWQRGAVNEVYRFLAKMFDIDVANRPEAPIFFKRKRFASSGSIAFDWMSNPTERNTQRVRSILKRSEISIPRVVQEWAPLMEELMPLIRVKGKNQVIRWLNMWPYFLLTLPEDQVPRSFLDIDRFRHVNSEQKDDQTFRNFLINHAVPDDQAQRAISQMARAWELSATLHGFHGKASNPFDVKYDPPKTVGKKKRRSKTARAAMDFDAFFTILDENRRGYYEFAKGIDRYTTRMRNPFTGELDDVFWPVEAMGIDVVLCTGSRNLDARWIDSGECDEYSVNLERKIDEPNELPCAIPGRRAGFLRVIQTNDPREPNLIGIFKLSNKTGGYHEFPYIPPALAENLQRLARQQALYNPIRKPVLLVDIRDKGRYLDESLYETACPLFRTPSDPMQEAVSPERLRAYWFALLVHCQPLVDAKLGYHYPLTKDGKALFDIHSLRVTLVTYLLDQDVDIETVRQFIGHSAPGMAVYYNAVRARALNKSVADALARNEDGVLDRALEGHSDALKVLAEESFEALVDKRATAGVNRLREMAEGTRAVLLDFFRHGLCANGDCNTGGVPVDGKPQPVWRPRACSRCMYRITSPRFLRGLIERTNMLALEINESFARTEAFNRRMADLETKTGNVDYKLRHAKDVEDRLRDQLCLEWVIEAQTTFIMEKIARRELLSREKSTESGSLKVGTYDVDPNLLSLGLGDMDGFELLQMVLKGAVDDPTSELEGLAERARQHVKSVKRMFRKNNLDDLLYRIPNDDEAQHLMRHTDLLINMFGGSKVREFIASSDEMELSPELAAPGVMQKLAEKFEPKVIADAAV